MNPTEPKIKVWLPLVKMNEHLNTRFLNKLNTKLLFKLEHFQQLILSLI